MRSYILRRLALLTGIIFVISVGSFMLIRLLPGDLGTILLGFANTPANKKELFARLGLDKPLVEQYLIWMSHVLQGDLGKSYVSGKSINSIIGKAIPIDLEIIFLSQLLALAVALPMSMKASRKPNGLFDRISNALSFGFLSIPAFVLVVYLVVIFGLVLHVPHTVPGSFEPIPGIKLLFHEPAKYFDKWRLNLLAMIVPAITGAIGSLVIYFRTLRSDLIANLQEEFITMARSKGLSSRRIMWRHALRPSSVALLSTLGINIGTAIAGGFVVQSFMGLPGLGQILVASMSSTDYIVIQSIVLVTATAVVVINFAVDFITTLIDPRIARD